MDHLLFSHTFELKGSYRWATLWSHTPLSLKASGLALGSSFDLFMKVPHRLDAVLLNHVMSGVELSRTFEHVSVAVDKGNVTGQSLQAGAICWPSNEAVIAVPQAQQFKYLCNLREAPD